MKVYDGVSKREWERRMRVVCWREGARGRAGREGYKYSRGLAVLERGRTSGR